LPNALYPDEHGTMYSGSAVVDWNNTTGFQTGTEKPLVAMFTAAGPSYTQGLAFSNDRGRTWTKYERNPVLQQIATANRDPKMAWYAPERKWVMALYLIRDDYAIFESHDLKQWKKIQDLTLPEDSECPNFFHLPLDGNANNQRWVFYGASGVYVVGNFDGQKFTPETQPQRLHHGNCWYASQVYSDIPASDGRCILVPWGSLVPWGRSEDREIFRGMPFNQMMGLPVELTLHSTSSGASLLVNPARELKSLRQTTHNIKPQSLKPGDNPLAEIHGDLFEIEAEIAIGDAKTIFFDLRGVPMTYDVAAQKISCLGNQSALVPQDGKISLHIFVDRTSMDIYGGHGTVYLPMAKRLSPKDHNLKLSSIGGSANIVLLNVYELKSAWE
jgi:fructan beta-fructosidase